MSEHRSDALCCELNFRERSALAYEAIDAEVAILWRYMYGLILAMGLVFESRSDASVPAHRRAPGGLTLRRVDEVLGR